MSRTAHKVLLAVVVVVGLSQTAGAFGHRGCWGGGCGWGGGWGCGWGGCYAGYGWGYPGYVGWGYAGMGYRGYAQPRAALPAARVAAQAAPADSGLLTVNVPADAKVFVNDHPTTSTGASRQYISRSMRAGATYTYRVRAEFVRNGQPVRQEKTVQLVAGQNSSLDFGEAAATAGSVATRR